MDSRRLDADKIERPVLQNRPADREAILVVAQRVGIGPSVARPVVVAERIAGIEEVVSQELVDSAAHPVRSRFQRDVHHGAGTPPQLGRVVGSLDLEFLHRVEIRDDDLCLAILEPEDLRVVINAVEDEVVLRGPLTV